MQSVFQCTALLRKHIKPGIPFLIIFTLNKYFFMRFLLPVLLLCLAASVMAQNNPAVQKPLPLPDSALYMCVEDFFTISGKGLAVTGRITTGKVSVGQSICIKGLQKDSLTAKVNAIEKYGALPATAGPGESVGLMLSALTKEELKRGMVVTISSFGVVKDTVEIEVKLLPKAAPVKNGSSLTLYLHCTDVYDCKAILPAGVTINPGQTKRFKVQTSVPVFVIPDAVFALRNNGTTTGTGKLIVAQH
jgi:translation elongation factor EF-Tu-like GTPase